MTLQNFWEWWSGNNQKIMEVRIKNYDWIKKISQAYNLPYSICGVYVSTAQELFNVIKTCRKHTTMWYGINPRKKSYSNKGIMLYGGKDVNVESIDFIFIDVDRINNKESNATNEELKLIEEFVNNIINDLKNLGINNYLRVFSGNGEQLIYKLDERIILPTPEYDVKNNVYLYDERLEKYKDLIKKTIGQKLLNKYNTKENKEKYGCEIDKAGFNIGRVGALPYSYNLKYNPIMRVIKEIVEGENKGLSDGLINELENLKLPLYTHKNKRKAIFHKELNHKAETIVNSKLSQSLLKDNLPLGYRNNYLIFQLKCLIKDCNIDFNALEIKHLQKMLEQKLNDKIPFNIPEEKFHFNPNIVNKFYIMHKLPLLYEPLFDRPKKRNFVKEVFNWDNYKYAYIPEECIPVFNNNDINILLYESVKWMERSDKNKTYTTTDYVYGITKSISKCLGEDEAKIIFELYLPHYLIK
jgi:hypothetical protein